MAASCIHPTYSMLVTCRLASRSLSLTTSSYLKCFTKACPRLPPNPSAWLTRTTMRERRARGQREGHRNDDDRRRGRLSIRAVLLLPRDRLRLFTVLWAWRPSCYWWDFERRPLALYWVLA